MNVKKAVCCAALSAVLAVSCVVPFAGSQNSLSNQPIVALSSEDGVTEAMEYVKSLKIGWNLGNTFDAPDGEITWGNPMTSPEMLKLVKELGFETIRIPISWGKHVSEAPEYTIDEGFMKRITTVVNQALDAGLHVIINSHHDNDIYMPRADNSQHGQEYLTAIWTQVGEHFKDYDYNLIFQTMNEPRVVGTSYEWSVNGQNPDCVAALGVVNELNQASLNAIRATGGKNADRYVIISPYAGNSGAATSSYFQLPEDSAENRLIVSIHAYTPYNLCLNRYSAETTFSKAKLGEITSMLKALKYRFLKNGVPIIIDEMGCLNKDNPEGRYEWAKAYVSAAKEYGIPCVWWDNGAINSSGENFGLINRRKLTVYEQSESVYQGLMEGLTLEK